MPRPSRRSAARFAVTVLEDRTLPALFGVTWPDPQNLSVSFAPDGTDVGGVASTLQSSLGGGTAADAWQGEIRRAFQTWAAVTNIDVHVVADDGGAFGAARQLQASATQGDIRIAARPLSTSQVAVANPPDLVSGWTGEIILNSNYRFSVDGAAGTYDLHSVVLHEAGHALGLAGNTTDPSAVMYEEYVGPRSRLGAADVAAIQALYSPRAGDVYEGSSGNGNLNAATAVNFLSTLSQTANNYVGESATPYAVRADITAAGDADVYRVNIPLNAASPVVQVSTSAISQLAAKVTVMDANGLVLLAATASAPGMDVRLDLSSLPSGQRYFVKVEAAQGGLNGIGGYRLVIGNAVPVAASGLFTSTFSTGGETLETNDRIGGIIFGNVRDNADARWDAQGKGQFASATDVQTMQLTAKDAANALVAAVWTAGAVTPTVRVTDSRGKAVAFQVLRADEFSTVIQILNVVKGAKYNVILSTGTPQASWTGPVGYRFAADFRAEPISLTTFASGTLTAAAPAAGRTLTVTQSQLFRFELTASSLLGQPNAAATLTVTDSTGKVVFALTAGAGQRAADDVFLTPGTYTVRITASAGTSALLPLGVVACIAGLTDPIGPSLLDPTAPAEPTPTTTAPTTATSITATSITATSTTSTSTTSTADTTTTSTDTTTSGYFWGVVLVDPLKIWW